MTESDRLAKAAKALVDEIHNIRLWIPIACAMGVRVEGVRAALAAYDAAKEAREAERQYLSWIYELASCETCVDEDEERYRHAMTQAPIALGRLLAARAKVGHGE